jgi:hypothetical protein
VFYNVPNGLQRKFCMIACKQTQHSVRALEEEEEEKYILFSSRRDAVHYF